MKVLVVGGTGRLGLAATRCLLEGGHDVRVMGRSAERATLPPGSEPFAGDVLETGSFSRALVGVDAVVTALSIPRTSRSPFAALTGPVDLHSRSTATLLSAMEAAGTRRLVKVSAQAVGDSAARAGWGFRALVAASNLAPAFRDHAVADDLVAASTLDWTVIRPPMLSDAPAAGPLRAEPDLVTWSWTRVPIGSVAQWIVDHLEDPETYGAVLSMRPA